MKREAISWKGSVKVEINGQIWSPDGSAKAIIVLVHGFGEHSLRYEGLADFFTGKGYAVFAADLPGHGRSGGKRGHVSSIERFLDFEDECLSRAKSKFPGLPVFLYGQSMGGNLIAGYLIKRKPDVVGAVLSSAWFRLVVKPPPLQVLLAKMVVNILPALTQPAKFDTRFLTHDTSIVKAYDEDPLVHALASPVLFLGVNGQGEWLIQNASRLEIPILVMHGSDDKLTSPVASEEFAKGAGKFATFKKWPGLFHELHFESNREEILTFALNWMEKLLKP